MKWAPFHHPDISLPVIARKLSNELLDLLMEFDLRSLISVYKQNWRFEYSTPTAYETAVFRLQRKGLIASRADDGGDPVLILTEKGRAQRPICLQPTRLWNQRWNGIWYVLVYDVPEKNRSYRDHLRRFLRRRRMGCLQDSVWVTPNDFRPEYSDLAEAADLGGYAFLFESRTVLGQSSQEVVLEAWKFNRLAEIQASYERVLKENLPQVKEGEGTPSELLDLARTELAAYLSVMRDDPLLPRKLWPHFYRGEEVYQSHREFSAAVSRRFQELT